MQGLNLESLNASQREAVTFDGPGPLLVLAGPGSGKTLTITQRVRFLTEVMGVSPDGILVLTFTKDAAISMKERYFNEINSVKHENVSQAVKQNNVSRSVNFGTFHSIFYHVLRQSTKQSEIQILKSTDKKRILLSVIENELSHFSYFEKNGLWLELLPVISYYKNTGKLEEATRILLPEVKEAFPRIFMQYENQRKQEGKLDFDDMLTDCREILEKNGEIRKYWQDRFDHILIDEFQDVNPAQYEVLKLLSKPPHSIFAVGDDDQSIYGFRGSDPACMKRFEKEFHAKTIVLQTNYRSTRSIVKASLALIDHNKDRYVKKLRSSEEEKALTNAKKDEKSVVIRSFQDKETQKRFLLEACREREASDDLQSMAVLFRTNKSMLRFAASLKQNGIDFSMSEKMQNPYEVTWIQDVLAYVRLAKNARDGEALARIINRPSRFVAREALGWSFENYPCNLMKGLIKYYEGRNGEVAERCMRLEGQLEKLRSLSPFVSVQYVRRVIDYDAWLKDQFQKEPESLEEAMEALEWLSEEAKEQKDLEESAKKWAGECIGNQNKKDDQISHPSKFAQIILMTVHASKGLEFDAVIIPDVNERTFPRGTMQDPKSLEEERRVFYVGMTRAKRKLTLTYLDDLRGNQAKPSRFLKEIGSV